MKKKKLELDAMEMTVTTEMSEQVPPTHRPPGGGKVKKPRPMNTALLPPCRVCGDKASGFHYGVVTCEACKGFFRRSLSRKQGYCCMQNDSCTVMGKARNQVKCAKCRYERCLELGMSKDGIQNGRYTLEKRTKYILEVKGEQPPPSSPSNRVDGAIVDINHNIDRYLGDSINSCDAFSPAAPTTAASNSSSSSDLLSPAPSTISMLSPAPISPITSVETAAPTVKQPPSPPRGYEETYLLSIIDNMTSVFYQNTDITPQFLQEKAVRERVYLEKKELETQIFGEMKPISAEEYKAIKQATGLDVDGRMEIINRINAKANTIACQMVNIGKAMPNFSELGIEDQTLLIKNIMRTGGTVLLNHYKYNPQLRLFHSSCNRIYSSTELQKFHTEEFSEKFFNILGTFQKLNFNDAEMVMSVAVCTLLTDGINIQQTQKVAEMLDICLHCLFYLLRKNHHNHLPHVLFARFTAVLTELRSLESMRHDPKSMEEMFDIELNPLFHEIWKTDST